MGWGVDEDENEYGMGDGDEDEMRNMWRRRKGGWDEMK